MKININKIRLAPPSSDGTFKLCCFGDLTDNLSDWTLYHNFKTEPSGKFTNIIIPHETKINDIFESFKNYQYVDGFSPNLNKHLHIGHLSNLVLAKTFQKLGIGNSYISILGDTVIGKVEHDEALKTFKTLIEEFDYRIDHIFYASRMEYHGDDLNDGEGDYEGTKVFEFEDSNKIVGIKSNGDTSYFYQDVALATQLNASTLYLTGNEQTNHFNYLKKICQHTNHIPLGLITTNGMKKSTRSGCAEFIHNIVDFLLEKFDDKKLIYNILAGQILKSVPKNNIEINMEQLANPKSSLGLYISYTLARMKSTGIEYDLLDSFNSLQLSFIERKSKDNLNPSLLFNEIVNLCKKINNLYTEHSIKKDKDNANYFIKHVQDLEYGMKILGLFSIEKV
jgi:arginyl-tRNA synthetase